MMSSGVICGKFNKETMLASQAKDIPGYTFGEALEKKAVLKEGKKTGWTRLKQRLWWNFILNRARYWKQKE